MIKIAETCISQKTSPFIIAEMSGNHNQSIKRALAIVDAAAEAGAHALKIQTYTADTMTINLNEREFHISDPASLWKGESLYDLYNKAHTPWDWHAAIFERARSLGLIAFSSPFDETAVDFLESLGAPAYKIASFENTDLRLIRKAAATGKPLIISTGMASRDEIQEAVSCARAAGCKELILLKCTSTYPASADNTNLKTIPDMRETFGCEVGISDHTLGIGVAVAAVAVGAVVIEKHLTLSRADGGVDSAFSLEPEEMRELVDESQRAWQALGSTHYGPTASERRSLTFRRSLYVVKDMKAGDEITGESIRSIRPGLGLSPKHFDSVLGKKLTADVLRGTPLTWELLV